jgi:hypothetical protein
MLKVKGRRFVSSDKIERLVITTKIVNPEISISTFSRGRTVHQAFIDFMKSCDLIRREILHNVPAEFGISMKVFRLTKMRLNGTYSKIRIKYMSGSFIIQNNPKEGDAFSSLLFSSALEYAFRN